METEGIGYLAAGFLAAFISGVIACTWMVQLVRKSKLSYFSIYCLIVGIIAIVAGLYL
jgi:undecaprenyl-diphosphatase